MPVVSRSRTIPAAPERIWTTAADPEHLPRWWPGVDRVEDGSRDAWTAVLTSRKGRSLRADYTLLESDHPRRRSWRHELDESPFERILSESVTELELEPEENGATRVTPTARLSPRGFSRLGGLQIRMATRRRLDGALEGLEALAGEWEAG
ncbi:MAG: SRPBCC family protein [Thermoleophilaceae bacterium]